MTDLIDSNLRKQNSASYFVFEDLCDPYNSAVVSTINRIDL
jgi:hypothetical protein